MYSLNAGNPGDYLWDRLWVNGGESRGGVNGYFPIFEPLSQARIMVFSWFGWEIRAVARYLND